MRKYLPLLVLLLLFSCTQLKLARDAYDQENYGESIAVCKKILATDSTNIGALEVLGDAYTKLNQLDSAMITFEKLVRLQPDESKFVEKLYRATLKRGDQLFPDDVKAAFSYYEKAEKISPNKPRAIERKGDVLFVQKRYAKAGAEFIRAAELNADSAGIRIKLAKIDSIAALSEQLYQQGLIELEKNKYEAAKKTFARALEIYPDHKEARYRMHLAAGLRLFKKGSVNALWDGIDNFAAASLLFPDRAEPHYYLGLAYNKKDKNEYTNAIDELQRAIELQPDSKWARAAAKEVKRIKARKKKMDAFWGN